MTSFLEDTEPTVNILLVIQSLRFGFANICRSDAEDTRVTKRANKKTVCNMLFSTFDEFGQSKTSTDLMVCDLQVKVGFHPIFGFNRTAGVFLQGRSIKGELASSFVPQSVFTNCSDKHSQGSKIVVTHDLRLLNSLPLPSFFYGGPL